MDQRSQLKLRHRRKARRQEPGHQIHQGLPIEGNRGKNRNIGRSEFRLPRTNTTAGLLICSDPSLALAKTELNEAVRGLTAKLKENDARDAFAEFERWTRERDRKCALDKDNVPLQEMS